MAPHRALPTLRGLPRSPPCCHLSSPLCLCYPKQWAPRGFGDYGIVELAWLLRIGDKNVQKKPSTCYSRPWVRPNYCCWQGPPRPLLLSAHPKVRLLFLFHILFACSLGSPSIKEWVGMREKLKCVITYSPSEPLASLRVICFLLYLVTRAHCAWLSLISIPHKPCCSGRLSKLKNQTFV